MNRRALGIAFLFALLGVFLLLLYQRRFETEASGGERIEVLVATKDIEPGTLITDEMIVTRKIPIAYTEDRAIKANEKNRLVGLKATTMVRTQQIILWTDIVSSGEERKDLSSLIRPGYVAMPIRLGNGDTSVALVKPGDYVDVFGILATANQDKPIAVLLLQRALVLASGTDTSPLREVDPKGGGRPAENSVTLSVVARDAQILALASDKGRLAVVVRRADDVLRAEIPDLDYTTLLNLPKKAPAPVRAQTGPIGLPTAGGGGNN